MFSWSHLVHVDSFGLLGTTSQHHAFRSIAEGKVITSSGDMGRLLSITCDKVQREAGLPVTHLTANTLRHMYVVWARTPGQQFTDGAEAGAQVCILEPWRHMWVCSNVWGPVGVCSHLWVCVGVHLPLPARLQAQMGNSKRKWDDTYDNEMAGRCQDELMRAQARRRGPCSQLQTATEEAQPLQSAAATGAQQGVARQAVVRRSVVLSTIGVQVKQPLKKENFITEDEALALGKTDLRTVWSHIYGRCVGLWTYADRCG